MEPEYIARIRLLRACPEALRWCAQHASLAAAWAACERGDWMLWLLGKLAGPPKSDSRKALVLAACECARLALPCVSADEERPLKAIETAESWARGEASMDDLRAAAYDAAAAAAADAADAAADAAAYAAYAAADAADAADAAAYARARTLTQCADIVRKHYPAPPELGEQPAEHGNSW